MHKKLVIARQMVFLLFSLFLLSIIFSVYYQYSIPQNIQNLKFPLPPGGFGFPLIGESLQFLFNLRNGVPEKFVIDRITKHSSKVFKTSIFGEPMVMFWGGAEGNKFLFANDGKTVQSWFPTALAKIFQKCHDDHEYALGSAKMFRSIIHPFLKADALHRYVPFVDAIMKQHIESHWDEMKELKVQEVASKYPNMVACRLLLCIEDLEKVESLRKGLEVIVKGVMSLQLNFPGTAFYRAVKTSKRLREEIIGIIKQRKNENSIKKGETFLKNEIMSTFLQFNDDYGNFMPEVDIASHLLGLVFASTQTTNSVLTFIMKYLAELPEVYNEVLREQLEIIRVKEPNELLTWENINKMRYSRNVMYEVMRLQPPSPGLFREATSDVVYNGYAIPKGWKFCSIINSTHKNPEYFPNPEKFNPSRFEGNGPPPYAFVPFGGGPSMCPGNEFAKIMILVFMHNVVTKFSWKKLISYEKIVCDPVPRLAQGLPIRLYAHSPH